MRWLVTAVVLLGLGQGTPGAGATLTPLWTRYQDGPPAGGDDQASALTVDSSGCVYVAGTSGSLPDLDYATVKYDPDGTLLWARRLDGGAHNLDFCYALAVDGDGNVYVTGGSILVYPHYDYLTIKYSPDGDTLWTRRFDGAPAEDDFAFSIAVDGSGHAYVTGQTNGSNGDITTIKYTPSGDVAWIRTFDGPAHGNDRANVVALDRLGNPHVAGWSFSSTGSTDFMTIKYDPAGNVLWSARYNGLGNSADDAFGLSLDPAGNVFVAGRSFGVPTFDYAAVKYDASGALQWDRRFIGPLRDDGFACALDADGNLYVTGYSAGLGTSEDIVTVKYAPNGDSLWVRGYNGPANLDDYAYAVAASDAGYVYVGGLSNGGTTSYDIVTLLYQPDGELIGTHRIDGSAHGYDNPGNGSYPTPYLAVDSGGNAYLTGFVSNTGTATDFVTVKYAPATVNVRDVPSAAKGVSMLRNVEPNPLRGAGVAEIVLPEAAPVSLEIFDLHGARRATLWDRPRQSVGSHRVPLDVSGLAEGVYFLALSTAGRRESVRIVVLR
jgi:uncharacterized delta-60 repeat protein